MTVNWRTNRFSPFYSDWSARLFWLLPLIPPSLIFQARSVNSHCRNHIRNTNSWKIPMSATRQSQRSWKRLFPEIRWWGIKQTKWRKRSFDPTFWYRSNMTCQIILLNCSPDCTQSSSKSTWDNPLFSCFYRSQFRFGIMVRSSGSPHTDAFVIASQFSNPTKMALSPSDPFERINATQK